MDRDRKTYWFGEKEVMVFRLYSQILEYGVRPETLHLVPVFDLTVPYGVVNSISRSTRGSQSFITDKEIQILGASLGGKMTSRTSTSSQERWLVRNGRPSRA